MSGAWKISRRTMLKGLGCAMGLPLLEQMGWADDPKGKAGKPPVRLGFLMIPNGVNTVNWNLPPRAGGAAKLSPTLEPLKNVMAELLVISNLHHDKANGNGDGAGDHARETGTFLTGAQIRKTAGTDIQCGQSADQLAASRIGHLTSLPSLELGVDKGGQAGNCDSGYSCVYTQNISWRTATSPMAKETDPRAVFQRLFQDVRQGAGAQAAGGEVMLRRSVLDLVREDAKRLRATLGGSDGPKLDEYLESIRAMEQRIEHAVKNPGGAKAVPADLKEPEAPKDFDQHVKLMFDLLTLAWQTDTTRVTSFMFGNGGSGRNYANLGITGGHHELSHHGNDPGKVEAIQKIDRYHVELFAYLLEKLKGVKEGNGTLLDNCMVLYGSGLGDGDRHNHNELPVLLAGRGGGTVNTGRPLAAKGNMCDLFLGMLARAGAPAGQFGDSSGKMDL